MTTFYNADLRNTTVQEHERPVICRAKRTIDLFDKAESNISSNHDKTSGTVEDWRLSSGVNVRTRRNRISVPIDINWTIQRAKNLWSNQVRPNVDTCFKAHQEEVIVCVFPLTVTKLPDELWRKDFGQL